MNPRGAIAPSDAVDVYVAAGSNIEPIAHLRQAIALLTRAFPDLRVSPAYANAAVGFSGDDFINLVVHFTTTLSLDALLTVLHEVEASCGRGRLDPKWAPRKMDLDLLLYGARVGEFPGAILPRPDLVTRPYMLGPLVDLAPELLHPVLRVPMRVLWEELSRTEHSMRPVSL